MLSPFAGALAYYLGGGFALALVCAALFLDLAPNDSSRGRLQRRAFALAAFGVIHPVIAWYALVLARDARSVGTGIGGTAVTAASTSLGLSLAVAVGVLAVVE